MLRGRALCAGLAMLATVVVVGGGQASAAPPTITSIPIGDDGTSDPVELVHGPDGAVWFTQRTDKPVGRVEGGVVSYVSGTDGPTHGIVVGPDGNVWVAKVNAGDLLRIDPDDLSVTTFHVGTTPTGIALGPDDRIWWAGSQLGSIDPAAADPLASVEHYSDAGIRSAIDIVAGPDDLMWFTDVTTGQFGSIDPAAGDPESTITLHADPANVPSHPCSDDPCPTIDYASSFLIAGPDDRMWFTANDFRLHSFDPSNPEATFTEHLEDVTAFGDLVVAPDGALWFGSGDAMARYDATTDQVVRYPDAALQGIVDVAVGPGDDLWFVDRSVDRIGWLRFEECVGVPVTVDIGNGDHPTPGDDVIVGTDGDDVIDGRGGDDRICGRGGNDTLNGGGGKDAVYGGVGADTVRSGPGGGALSGGLGADELFGGREADTITAGAGDDAVVAGAGNDTVYGSAGRDSCSLAPGRDVSHGCEVVR
jgi:streptogramin lyase